MKRLLLALAAVALALYAQSLLDWLFPANSRTLEAALLYAAAAVLFVALFRRENEPFLVGVATPVLRRGLAYASYALAIAAAILGVLAAARLGVDAPAAGSWTIHLASVGAILLAALFYSLAHRAPGARPPSPVAWLKRHWLPTLALLALMVAAAVLRIHELGLLPEGIWYDEAVNALTARKILADPTYRPFYLHETFHTAHHNYLVALSFRLFGESIASARLVSALLGILLVPAGWLLAYEFFQTRPVRARTNSLVPLTMAFALAALLAFVPWSINLSRIAVNYIATPLFAVVATALLLRAMRTQSILAYAGSGLALVLGLYGYTSFRLFAPVLPLFVLAVLFHRRDAWRDTWRNTWRGLIVLSLVALIAAAPLLSFAMNNRTEFMQRANDVSLFKDRPVEARGELLAENLRAHLLMFTVKGDANGRHNLPDRPMLDPWLSALFVLGVALSLWRWRHPLHLLLLLWLGCTLLGGILSLDFEAPQSLRANGALPAALLLALVPVGEVLRLWERTDGGVHYPRTLPGIVVAALVPLLAWNWHAYFRVQAQDFSVWNSFSTGETLIARTLATLSPETNDVWVMSNFQRRGDVHPTLRFLAPQWVGNTRTLNSWDSMPLVWTPAKDAWLFFDFDTELPYRLLQSFYPAGDFADMKPEFSASVAGYRAHLTSGVAGSTRGVDVTWYAEDSTPISTARVPNIDLSLVSDAPEGSVYAEFRGILRISEYGDYRLALTAPDNAEVWLDETSVFSGTDESATSLPLATGNHTLRVRADVPDADAGGAADLSLAWARPATEDSVIPADVLFAAPVTANGLLGIYREDGEAPADEDARVPLLAAIDQQVTMVFHTTPVPRPFHVEWTGKIALPVDGVYGFTADAIDEVTLEIDGETLVVAGQRGVRTEVSLPLSAGLHDIRVLLKATEPFTRVFVEWAPPGLDFSPLPSQGLFPPLGSYAGVPLPALALPVDAVTEPDMALAGIAGPLLDTPVTIVVRDLDHPVGIAASGGSIYVADSAAARVLIYDESGEIQREIPGGAEPFVEPFDLALDQDGTLLVSDAAAPALYRFDSGGEFLENIVVEPPLIDRARGIDLAADGSILLAQTPGQRIVHLRVDGSERAIIPAMPEVDAQPVDVAALADGGSYAALLGVDLLVRYDSNGTRMLAIPLATANSQDAPHLAAAPSGDLFVTQPEEGRILWYGPDASIVGHWDLRASQPGIKPVGIAIESLGEDGTRIWFTDVEAGRIGWVPAPPLEAVAP